MTLRSWTRAAWVGSILNSEKVDRGGYTVPGRPDVYYWSSRNSGGPYAGAAWGGGLFSERAYGGIVATPDADSGVVTLQAWWANARTLTIDRIGADGERIPVRGGPFTVTGKTRRNDATNPRGRDDLTGYVATSGTLSRLTGVFGSGLPASVTTAVRATAPSNGTAAVRFSLDTIPPYPTVFGMWVRTSAVATALTLNVSWYDSSSILVATTSVTPSSVAASQTVAGFSWCEFPVVPSTSGQYGSGVLTATGLGNGGTLDVTGRLWQTGEALDGPFFDGDTFGGGWRGTPGASSSLLAPVSTIIDAEAPLDAPVLYELTTTSSPGYAAATGRIVMAAKLRPPREALLSHPGQAATIRVWVEAEPELTRSIERNTFQVIGRRRPVVVTAPQRNADSGSLTFVTEGQAERDRLLGMLDDGSPLLLRAPADHGHPPLWWLSFGDVTITPPTNDSRYDLRRLSVDFVEVDRPSSATRPLVA